jgi:hypothetical protein
VIGSAARPADADSQSDPPCGVSALRRAGTPLASTVAMRHPSSRPLSVSSSVIPFPRPLAGQVTDPPATAPQPRLLDRVRAVLRARHYSRRTEESYVGWIRR